MKSMYEYHNEFQFQTTVSINYV